MEAPWHAVAGLNAKERLAERIPVEAVVPTAGQLWDDGPPHVAHVGQIVQMIDVEGVQVVHAARPYQVDLKRAWTEAATFHWALTREHVRTRSESSQERCLVLVIRILHKGTPLLGTQMLAHLPRNARVAGRHKA